MDTRKKQIVDRGSGTLLFLGLVLPILALCGLLTLDMGRLLEKRRDLQQIADDAALLGARNLPHTDLARTTTLQLLASRGIRVDGLNPSKVDLNITPGKMSIGIEQSMALPLAQYFVPNASVTVAAASRASPNPRVVDLFLDTSDYMAPDPLTAAGGAASDDAAWGIPDLPPFCSSGSDSQEDQSACNAMREDIRAGRFWPPADLVKKMPLVLPLAQGKTEIPPLLATQQCFSPPLSAAKEAMIRIYEFLSASPHHRVGVLTGPVLPEGVSVLSEIGERSLAAYPSFGGDGISDEYCLALSEHERHHQGYRVPEPSHYSSGLSAQSFTEFSDGRWSIDPSRIGDLDITQAIWGRSVARRVLNNDLVRAKTDSLQVVTTMRRRFLGASHLTNERIAAPPTYDGLILLGDMPWVHGERIVNDGVIAPTPWRTFSKALEQFAISAAHEKMHVHLLFIVFRHFGNYGSVCRDQGVYDAYLPCGPFVGDGSALYDAFQTFNQTRGNQYFSVSLAKVPDLSSMTQDALSIIPLFDQAVLLER